MKKAPDELHQIARWMAAYGIGFLELRMPEATVRLGNGGQRNDDAPPLDTVTSASVGVFLHAHPCASAPFVRAGTHVHAGKTLGLLRIGVLLLPVTASRAGTVAALRVEDGATVGYGAALVDLHPL